MVNGVYFFVCGHAALAVLGTVFGVIGIHFSPILFGGMLAAMHIVCGLTMVMGFFFRWSCFLLGSISLLEAAIAIFMGKSILNDVAYIFIVSMVTFGLMFTGSGKFSATKK
jgi:putative oxidoreductase